MDAPERPSVSTDPGEWPTLRGLALPSAGPADAEPPAAGDLLGHYRILDPLGSGGFGMVWRAQDTRLLREVALKFLPSQLRSDPEALARLEAEARIVAALDHPGIVTLHALEEAGGRLFLVMERVRGKTLAEAIPSGGLAVPRALDLAIQVARALEVSHGIGVVHRDLNPRNVMVTEDGRVKILDFGLALNQAAGLAPVAEAEGSGLSGTLPYMAPEQVRAEPVDARTDLYSLGAVLFEMVCGRRPFVAPTVAELARAILCDPPRIPAELPVALTAILRRCLAKEPAGRFPTCTALLRALEDARQPVRARADERPSVAVLPFVDLSPQEDEGHLGEGMAEEILTALARIEGLRVVSRTSSFLYRNSRLDAREIGRRLPVGALLVGSVRKEGGRLRVSAELMEVASGSVLWAEMYDRERREVFRIQEEVVAGIAGALSLTAGPADRRAPSLDLEAYEDYLRGRQYYFRYNRHGMRFAMQMFRQALQRDPGYAAAWAGLANCAAFLYIYADRSEAHRDLAESASRRALELDPGLAEAHASRGVALSAAGRSGEADAAFERALACDPGLYEANYLFARHCFASDRLERAEALFERAAEIYPEDCQAPLLVAQVHASLGRTEEAAAARLRGLALAEERLRRNPDDVRTRYLGANALVALGEREQGLAWARSARALDPDDPMLLYNLGCIHALAGDVEEAIDCLERAVAAGLTQKGWFLNDGDLQPLRGHPRFCAMVDALA